MKRRCVCVPLYLLASDITYLPIIFCRKWCKVVRSTTSICMGHNKNGRKGYGGEKETSVSQAESGRGYSMNPNCCFGCMFETDHRFVPLLYSNQVGIRYYSFSPCKSLILTAHWFTETVSDLCRNVNQHCPTINEPLYGARDIYDKQTPETGWNGTMISVQPMKRRKNTLYLQEATTPSNFPEDPPLHCSIVHCTTVDTVEGGLGKLFLTSGPNRPFLNSAYF